jgi:glycosyltransferase involved in cell wall biosynthesis
VLQRAFHLNHLFGGLGDWFHLKAIRRRPSVLTVATATHGCNPELLSKVDRFVVEWPGAREDLVRLGVENSRIQLVYPPVNLTKFAPTPPPEGPFTILFASSPERRDWLAGRGVLLLLDVAAEAPQCRFRLLWRPWGDALVEVRRQVEQRRLNNVEICVGRFEDMPQQYAAAHATIIPFVDMEQCKPAPNSLIESLACGRPVISTDGVGLAEFLRERRAGVVCPANVGDLAEAVNQANSQWINLAGNARLAAETEFCNDRFLDAYTVLYRELVA